LYISDSYNVSQETGHETEANPYPTGFQPNRLGEEGARHAGLHCDVGEWSGKPDTECVGTVGEGAEGVGGGVGGMKWKGDRTMKLKVMIFLTALVTVMSTNVLAECGWILWHDLQEFTGRDSSQKEWTVAETADTFAQCAELRENALVDHFNRLTRMNDNTLDADKPTIVRGGSVIVTTYKHGRSEIRYSCWPETRDPRH